MLRLIKPQVTPPGGFRFTDPDTQFEYNRNYKTFSELESHVDSYRSQNKLTKITDFRTVWEAYVCQFPEVKPSCCGVSMTVRRSFEQYWAGAKAYFKTIMSDNPFVEQDVANERAKTCQNCNQNLTNIGHRQSNFYTDRFILNQTKGRTTPYDKDLFTCKICTCLLRSKVHYNSDTVKASLTKSEIYRLKNEPKHILNDQRINCWQLDTLNKPKQEEGDNGKETGSEEKRSSKEGIKESR